MTAAIVEATIQGTILSIISNILAQTIQSYRTNAPFTLNLQPIITFALYSILNTPPNFLWQELLEGWFPSRPKTGAAQGKSEKPSVEGTKPELQKLSKTNTAKKFVVDQLVSGPLNTIAFLAFMKSFSAPGGPASVNVSDVWRETRQDFWSLHLASLKLWPAVALLSFTLIPVQRRVVFGSIVALGWNIYLGLAMS